MRIYRQKQNGKLDKKWTVAIKDHTGVRRKFVAFADKNASRSFGNQLEKLIAYHISRRPLDEGLSDWIETLPRNLLYRLERVGLVRTGVSANIKPLMVSQKNRRKQSHHISIDVTGGHLFDYEKHMKSRELSTQHISQVISHCARFFDARKLLYPADISVNHIERYVSLLRDNNKSARTVNCALAAIKSFCNWMVKEGRIANNPAARVNKLNEKTDRRVIRRPLTVEEVQQLLRATEQGKVCEDLSGLERSVIYRLALCTGLRFNEIRTLELTDFSLDGENPTVTVQAQNEKAGRGAVLPLTGDKNLARDLQELFNNRPISLFDNKGNKAFSEMMTKGAKMIRSDLKVAKVNWIRNIAQEMYQGGQVMAEIRAKVRELRASDFLEAQTSQGKVDFHALRHTFGTWLAKSGVHPKICQEMMRHASIETTMQLYTHTLLDDKTKAAQALPDFNAGGKDAGAESA